MVIMVDYSCDGSGDDTRKMKGTIIMVGSSRLFYISIV